MSSVPTSVPSGLKANQAVIVGRIVAVRKINGQNGSVFLHLVKTPAPDQYSSPQTLEISAKSRLGDIDTDCKVVVNVGGFGNTYKQIDRDTGEERNVRTANNRLTAVE